MLLENYYYRQIFYKPKFFTFMNLILRL